LDIPPAGRLSTGIADAVVVEVKPLQTAVFFEPFSQGLAVSGQQHRDGLPFSTAKAQEQIRGKSTGGARPKPASSEWESIGNLSQAGRQKRNVFNFQHAFTGRKRPGLCGGTVFELCGGTASDQTMPNHSL